MKKIHLSLLASTLIVVTLQADVSMQTSHTLQPPDDDHPHRPERVKPVVQPIIQYGEHYHTYVTTHESSCTEYIDAIKEKDAQIEALLQENAALKEKEQKNLQKRLKEEYDTELKRFEERGK